MYQKTLHNSFHISGKGLHTGIETAVSVHPAPENHGIVFQIKQMNNTILIPAHIDFIDDLVRGTTLSKDGVKVHTIEHLLSALYGLDFLS